MSLPTATFYGGGYMNSKEKRRLKCNAEFLFRSSIRFLKTPLMKRILSLLLLLPIPILTFFMGRASSLPTRRPVSLTDYTSAQTARHDARFDKWAIALKTGEDVALKRTPIQLMTFLAAVRDQVCLMRVLIVGYYDWRCTGCLCGGCTND